MTTAVVTVHRREQREAPLVWARSIIDTALEVDHFIANRIDEGPAVAGWRDAVDQDLPACLQRAQRALVGDDATP